MNDLVNHKITGQPVFQNKQDFIVSVFTIKQIFKFTRYTNRLIVGFDENEEPIYNESIQRELELPRVQKIADYLIHDPEATFPTNIVLHIPIEVIEEQKRENDRIELRLQDKLFEELIKDKGDIFISIIDGQHRIKGIEQAIETLKFELSILNQKSIYDSKSLDKKREYFRNRLEDLLNIELVVSFFIDKTLEYQAMIFSTINRTQKRVSPSLVSSLFGLDTTDTPHKTALQVALSLNGSKKSPFYKRVKLYGGSYSKRNSPPLTQATFVKSIVNLICESLRESEKDRYKSRKELLKRSNGSKRILPFRNFYAKDEDDKISDLLFYYFNSVRTVFLNNTGNSFWEIEDDSSQPTNILQTTVGYDALLNLMVDIFEDLNPNSNFDYGKDNLIGIFKNYLSKVKEINFNDTTKYSFNNRGKRILYIEMFLRIWPAKPISKKYLVELDTLLRSSSE